jgi:protein-S-isoprenylcysteine O-methyltransferase Ste14
MKRRKVSLHEAMLYGAAAGALLATWLIPGRNRTPAMSPFQRESAFFERIHMPWLAFDNALRGHFQFLLGSLAVWCAFSVYWEIAAKSAAATQSSESRASRRLHVFLVNMALLLVIAPVRGFGRFLPVSPIIMAAGVLVEVIGLVLAIWARRHLGRNWSGAIAIKVEHQLIRSGPYRLLRHPIYTGILAMYIGLAVVTGEWLGLLGVALTALAYWRKIRLEEAALDAAFGPDYDAYRRATWALVPGLF